MKFVLCGVFFAAAAWGAALGEVKSVYLMPMPSGFDQHLANQLTRDHVFQVVSDPKLADAIFTDNLGAAFEYKLEHINPPKPATPPATPAPAPAAAPGPPMFARSTEDEAPHESTFTHGRGTVFLVDAKSKQVLWSGYNRPKDAASGTLEHTARRVVQDLQKALNPPKDKGQVTKQ